MQPGLSWTLLPRAPLASGHQGLSRNRESQFQCCSALQASCGTLGKWFILLVLCPPGSEKGHNSALLSPGDAVRIWGWSVPGNGSYTAMMHSLNLSWPCWFIEVKLLLCYIKLLYFLNGIYFQVFPKPFFLLIFFFSAFEGPSCWTESLKILLVFKAEKNL